MAVYFSRTETIKKVIAYARYSSDHQNPISIEIQIEGIREYCKKNGYEIVATFADEAKSGGGTGKRTNYLKMLDEIKNNLLDFDALIVYRYDRAGRNVHDMKVLEAILLENKKRFISATEKMAETTAGIFHKNIQYAVNEYERGVIGDRSFDGLKSNARDGLHCGGVPPLGYMLDEEQKLIIDVTEAEAVRKIFEMYDDGYGYGNIAARLNEMGYLTKRKLKFKKNSIHDILINEKYQGTYCYNKAYPRDPNGKNNSHKYKDDEDIIRVHDNHPAIIDKEMFARVQERIKLKSRKARESKNNYILRGMIQCRNCGAMLHGDVNRDSKNKSIIRSHYRCPNKKVKACDVKPVNRFILEDFVLELLHKSIFQNANIEQITELINHIIENDEDMLHKIKRYKEALKEQKQQEENLYRSLKYSKSDSMISRITNQIEELSAEQAEFKEKIQVMEEMQQRRFTQEQVQEAIQGLNEYVKANNTQKVKNYLSSYIKKVIVDNEDIEIIFNEENKCA
ncbi:recombinase family protein [Anaerosinus gibii]|uniref:Recombinase family protein n=1 Tax=Selenobaculum gibii TaxID=3054208 RepID=A0A9Y2AEV0_9FIRM|nr:recombinase family protein [Selenobaculum gbiensis]WIW70285.1 recombinase family protein [Selenobaculum gbiensis]